MLVFDKVLPVFQPVFCERLQLFTGEFGTFVTVRDVLLFTAQVELRAAFASSRVDFRARTGLFLFQVRRAPAAEYPAGRNTTGIVFYRESGHSIPFPRWIAFSTSSRLFAVISIHAGRKPLRMAFRTEPIFDQAAQ